MNYDEFDEIIPVSRETFLRLEKYVLLLKEWSGALNLVSSLEDVWHRHIIDCAQLAQYLPKNESRKIVDLGCGAGLPGVILALMTEHHITMIESDRRKSIFVDQCIRELGIANAEIINKRIEKCDLRADIVVSRALASLSNLFELSQTFFHVKTVCLFSKGQNYASEYTEAEASWKFDAETKSSVSGNGVILSIRNLKKKKSDDKSSEYSESKGGSG